MKLLKYVLLLCLLSSCSLSYKIADQKSTRVLKREHLKYHSLDAQKYNITYWDSESDKPVLLLIHGFGTSGNFQWYKEAHALSKNYRLIIVNLLYFGSTAKVPSYNITSQVDAVQLLMEKLKIHSYYLCGSSYGGLVAAELALKEGRRINKLILMDAPVKYLTHEDIDILRMKYHIDDQENLLVPKSPEALQTLMNISYKKKPKLPLFIIRQFYNNNYIPNQKHLHEVYRNILLNDEFFSKKNYHYSCPVLLIWGEEDELVPLHIGYQLQKHIGPNSNFVLVPRAAHLPNLENKNYTNKLILDFLKKDSDSNSGSGISQK
jgi:pimeloyl-ACP methyl ester carboxylesterase